MSVESALAFTPAAIMKAASWRHSWRPIGASFLAAHASRARRAAAPEANARSPPKDEALPIPLLAQTVSGERGACRHLGTGALVARRLRSWHDCRVDLGVHLPLMQFGEKRLSLGRLEGAVDAARDCGYAALSTNDHFVFQTPSENQPDDGRSKSLRGPRLGPRQGVCPLPPGGGSRGDRFADPPGRGTVLMRRFLLVSWTWSRSSSSHRTRTRREDRRLKFYGLRGCAQQFGVGR